MEKSLVGQQVVCPGCRSTRVGDYDPIMVRVDLFTCRDCGTRFNAHNGSTGPFVVLCSQGHDMPCDELSKKCVICGEDLAERKKLAELDWKEPKCSNCGQRNFRGRDQCIRCGEYVGADGQVRRINVH